MPTQVFTFEARDLLVVMEGSSTIILYCSSLPLKGLEGNHDNKSNYTFLWWYTYWSDMWGATWLHGGQFDMVLDVMCTWRSLRGPSIIQNSELDNNLLEDRRGHEFVLKEKIINNIIYYFHFIRRHSTKLQPAGWYNRFIIKMDPTQDLSQLF